ncbi:MAG: YkgJ family cysteine cluster protein [Cryomorphaceae bacterium]|nr:YkgJ family cysteine cluster protein [Cryomorphaceae bacterium]
MSKRKHHKKSTRPLEALKKVKPAILDAAFAEADEEVFAEFDCLTCANCCKTTGPLFTDGDIDRIARHLNMRPGSFTETYLRIDEDGDYVLKSVPCTFLENDNRCSIYDVRPKACREYPHTQQKRQHSILHLTEKNIAICPAAEKIVQKVMAAIK